MYIRFNNSDFFYISVKFFNLFILNEKMKIEVSIW